MYTCCRAMAAEDLTGPPALKVHSKTGFAGKLPSARPSREGPPRNIGQSAATAGAPINPITTPNANPNPVGWLDPNPLGVNSEAHESNRAVRGRPVSSLV